MSSLPWVPVNYFSPLTKEENTETKSMPNHPQEVEEVDVKEEYERAEAGDDEQPTEGMAEWMLWVMHQNAEEGRGALERWTHRGRKSEATQETVQAILGLETEMFRGCKGDAREKASSHLLHPPSSLSRRRMAV